MTFKQFPLLILLATGSMLPDGSTKSTNCDPFGSRSFGGRVPVGALRMESLAFGF